MGCILFGWSKAQKKEWLQSLGKLAIFSAVPLAFGCVQPKTKNKQMQFQMLGTKQNFGLTYG